MLKLRNHLLQGSKYLTDSILTQPSNEVSVVAGRNLMSLLMIQRMVNMKVIVAQTYQKDTPLMDIIVTLMNIISMIMIIENHQ